MQLKVRNPGALNAKSIILLNTIHTTITTDVSKATTRTETASMNGHEKDLIELPCHINAC